jgi:hypothetical protein
MPFIIFLTILLFYSLLDYKTLKVSLKTLLNNFFLAIILAIILIFSFIFSEKFFVEIFKDVLNVIVLFLLFIISFQFTGDEKNIKYFVDVVFKLIIAFALLISVKFIFNLLEIKVISIYTTDEPGIDINFGLIPLILGIISSFSIGVKSKSALVRIVLNFFSAVFFFSILSVGSRRGILILFAFLIFLLISLVLPLIKRNELIQKIA